MRLVKPGYEIFAASEKKELPYSYDNSENLIEVAGRTCYKSEDQITKESSANFVRMLQAKGHCAMIEHSWEIRYYNTTDLPHYKFLNYLQQAHVGTVVAGNIRAFNEWDYEYKNEYEIVNNDEAVLNFIHEQERWDMLSATVKIITDRGVTHEQVRHRPPAYAQESTRWCNYCQSRFGNHLAFAIPIWLEKYLNTGIVTEDYYSLPSENDDGLTIWLKDMCIAERSYQLLSSKGWIPGRARSVLPNSLKTEIVVTADLAEWKHIFKLRTAPDAHEQMREIMIPLQVEFRKIFPEIFI